MGLTAQSRVPVQLEMQPPERLREKEKGGIVFKAGRGLFFAFCNAKSHGMEVAQGGLRF